MSDSNTINSSRVQFSREDLVKKFVEVSEPPKELVQKFDKPPFCHILSTYVIRPVACDQLPFFIHHKNKQPVILQQQNNNAQNKAAWVRGKQENGDDEQSDEQDDEFETVQADKKRQVKKPAVYVEPVFDPRFPASDPSKVKFVQAPSVNKETGLKKPKNNYKTDASKQDIEQTKEDNIVEVQEVKQIQGEKSEEKSKTDQKNVQKQQAEKDDQKNKIDLTEVKPTIPKVDLKKIPATTDEQEQKQKEENKVGKQGNQKQNQKKEELKKGSSEVSEAMKIAELSGSKTERVEIKKVEEEVKATQSARGEQNPSRGATSARRGGADRGSRGGARGGKTADIKKVISAFDIDEDEKKQVPNLFEQKEEAPRVKAASLEEIMKQEEVKTVPTAKVAAKASSGFDPNDFALAMQRAADLSQLQEAEKKAKKITKRQTKNSSGVGGLANIYN